MSLPFVLWKETKNKTIYNEKEGKVVVVVVVVVDGREEETREKGVGWYEKS